MLPRIVVPPPPAPPEDDDPRRDRPRSVRAGSSDDVLLALGAVVASFGLVWLIYEWVLPFSGDIGFLVCWYVAFVGLWALLTSLGSPRPLVIDRVATCTIWGGAGLVGAALVYTVVAIFVHGWPALRHIGFYSQTAATSPPTAAVGQGGIEHAIVGSFIQIGIAVAVSLPLGLGTAIYMTEVRGRGSQLTRTVVEAMTALPDVLAGLFIYTTVVVRFGVGKSGLAAGLALSVMMLPIIARAGYVSLSVVPGGLREASLALGASRWQTVWRVVLPTARPGLATALILGIARGIGETAPVLLTSGATNLFNKNPLHNPMESLPLYAYYSVRGGVVNQEVRGWGALAVLLAIVLVLFVLIRLLARTRTGNR